MASFDFINSKIEDSYLIESIINAPCFSTYKKGEDKDIFRIGKKGVMVTAKKRKTNTGIYDNSYSHLWLNIKPHYYFNNDLHNGNVFTPSDCVEVLNDIAEKLNIKKHNLIHLTSSDFGNNIVPDTCDTCDIIDGSIYYKKKPFLITRPHLPYFKTTKDLDTHPTIAVKTYHKGIQFAQEYNDVHPNTWRYEICLNSNRKLKDTISINNYSDLLKIDTYNTISKYILESWKHILILDDLNTINNPQSSPVYWYDERHFNGINGFKNKVNEYLKTGKLHKELFELLQYTINEKYNKVKIPLLIDSWNNHLTLQNSFKEINKHNKIDGNYCIITNEPIGMQREGNPHLKREGLRHLYETNPIRFMNLYNAHRETKNKRKAITLEDKIVLLETSIRKHYMNHKYKAQLYADRNYSNPNQLQFSFN